MIKGYKVKIYPTDKQRSTIIRWCHAARWAYNWAIATENDYLYGNRVPNLKPLEHQINQSM